MKKVYVARRIPINPAPHLVLSINSSMSVEEIHTLYVEKTCNQDNYIYNGPWILRSPLSDLQFSPNQLPDSLFPVHIWGMVKEKIESSDVVVGIVNGKSYGTIAELGYACKCNIATYVLPDKNLKEDELQDLWFLFQMIKTTKALWSESHICAIKEFREFDIQSLEQYESLINEIVPNFMKK